MKTIFARFVELRADVAAVLPGFRCSLIEAKDREMFPAYRSLAFCADDEPPYITVAPDLKDRGRSTVDAILMHELGHAVDFVIGAKEMRALLYAEGIGAERLGPERRADAFAELLWGQVIRYDANDVQTFSVGISPRPRRLGL